MSNSLQKLKIQSHKLPDLPGVYFFRRGGTILYIGKATSLKSRVRSYLGSNLLDSRGVFLVQMIEEANSLSFQKTDSVLEALILEANLIKKYQPKYNTAEKDNKSFNYVVITKENFPRVLLIRGRELETDIVPEEYAHIFGPFPQSGALKEGLKIIRKIFPFRDTCTPFEELSPAQKEKARGCFNYQLGLCPGVCVGKISQKEYAHILRNIKLFFEGKKAALIRGLKADMKRTAKKLEFEKAADIRKTMFALEHIRDVSLIKRENDSGAGGTSGFRIEAYDIAHTGGDSARGVMVVVKNGEADKSQYRLFSLRATGKGDDIGALKEILERRLNHGEWTLPDLIVIDGGETHLKAAREVVAHKGFNITCVSVVKDERHKPKAILGDSPFTSRYHDSIILANSEAHRFSITRHRQALRKNAFDSTRRWR